MFWDSKIYIFFNRHKNTPPQIICHRFEVDPLSPTRRDDAPQQLETSTSFCAEREPDVCFQPAGSAAALTNGRASAVACVFHGKRQLRVPPTSTERVVLLRVRQFATCRCNSPVHQFATPVRYVSMQFASSVQALPHCHCPALPGAGELLIEKRGVSQAVLLSSTTSHVLVRLWARHTRWIERLRPSPNHNPNPNPNVTLPR